MNKLVPNESATIGQEQREFTASLFQAARSLRLAMDRRLRPLGFSQPTWMLLSVVAREGPVTQRDLAEKMGIESATLVGVLDRLEREKLVERRASDSDRRAKMVHLLPRGQERIAIIDAAANDVRAEVLKDLPLEDLRRVKEFTDLLRVKAEAV